MDINITSTVGLLEIIWVLTALVGVIVSTHLLSEARKDNSVLKQEEITGSPLNIVARGNIRHEWERLVLQTVCFGLGITTLFLPQPAAQANQVISIAFRFGFIVLEILAVRGSWADVMDRRRLTEQMQYYGTFVDPRVRNIAVKLGLFQSMVDERVIDALEGIAATHEGA